MLALLAGSIAAASAAANCTCRFAGKRFELGTITCIGGPNGGKLAQCQMNLNNTSWQVLSDGCPTAMLLDEPPMTPLPRKDDTPRPHATLLPQ